MMKLLVFSKKNIIIITISALTLGLAPFSPEPHVWEKLKWIWRGTEGMVWYDWFDLLLHGTPWILLLFAVVGKMVLGQIPEKGIQNH